MRVGYTLKRLQDFARAGIILKKLNVHDRWTREKLAQFQHQQLLRLVAHAIHHSPFYQGLYKNIRTDQPIVPNKLPIIDKAMMMENFDRFVTDPRLKLTELQAHISQLTRDDYYLGEYRVVTTAGSSGMKGVFVFDRKEWSTILAGTFRCGLIMAGSWSSRLPNRWRASYVVADSPMHMTYRFVVSSDNHLVKTQRLKVTSSVEDLVDALNTFQPEVLYTYPSIASLLAIAQLGGHLNIHPQVVSTGAEVRTNEMELKIREAWGVVPFNVYGVTEAGNFGCDCSFHRGLHLFEDLLIVEVVDEQNQPVPDGAPGYKFLLTNLFNFTQPLIRYEVSDMLTMAAEPCPCGRPFRLIAEVEGRSDDIIYLQTPQGRDVPVHPIHFRSPIGAFQEIKEYRVLHQDDGINISIVLREGTFGEEVASKLRSNLRKKIESVGAKCPEIRVQFVDRIDRDPNLMGKLKLVKSNVKREKIRKG
jgi:putative adenylate-forming enzyme